MGDDEAAAGGGDASRGLGGSNLDTVRNLLGLLLAGFIGALNFVGLKSGEIPTVLRNEAVVPSLIAALMLFALLFAVSSVFVEGNAWVARSLPIAAVVALIGLGALTVLIVPIPGTTTPAQIAMSGVGGGILIAGALVVETRTVYRRKQAGRAFFWFDPVPARTTARADRSPPADGARVQLVLLLVGAMLAAIATYMAIRLEARSQSEDPIPEAGAKVTQTGGQGALSLDVSASRLRAGSHVGVRVDGLPRSVALAQACAAVAGQDPNRPCTDDPCRYLGLCEILDGMSLGPDASGTVQQTLVMPFSPAEVQHLSVKVQTCEARGATCAFVPGRYARLDFSIPPPVP